MAVWLMVGLAVWVWLVLLLLVALPPLPLAVPPVAVVSPVLLELLAELSTVRLIGVVLPPEPLPEPEL